jgi:hypothetical protein
MTIDGNGFNEEDLYDQFPSGADHGFGPDEGFNTYRKLNDASLFKPELLDAESEEFDPVLAEFVASGERFSVSFAQFKSSTRESEWALHKPHKAMAGEVPGIVGPVDKFPGSNQAHIASFFINHDRTMARWKQSVIVMEDGAQAGQMVYKEEKGPDGLEQQ